MTSRAYRPGSITEPPLVVVVVVVVVVVLVVAMVMMMVIVNEFHVRVLTRGLATRGGRGCVCDPQKRGGVWNGIKQFAK